MVVYASVCVKIRKNMPLWLNDRTVLSFFFIATAKAPEILCEPYKNKAKNCVNKQSWYINIAKIKLLS